MEGVAPLGQDGTERDSEKREREGDESTGLEPANKRSQLHADWDKFYGKHKTGQYLDRHWLWMQFPELFPVPVHRTLKDVVSSTYVCACGSTIPLPDALVSEEPRVLAMADLDQAHVLEPVADGRQVKQPVCPTHQITDVAYTDTVLQCPHCSRGITYE
ncbi:hypothetical protein KIPB_002115, partial [Kipferlia bialata]|eukprot:g2115.t1